MKFLSLCSGIESASVAAPPGWHCVAVAEIDKFPCAVLNHHYPDVPNLGDVNLITKKQIRDLGPIDLVIFGFPCQDLSIAGKRKGLTHADGTHTRSGLFFACAQIADWSNARWIVAENVPGLFSANAGRDFASVVGELAGSDYNVPGEGWRSSGVALGPKGLVEWFVLDAQYCGLAQRRKRVFLVRDSGNWPSRPPLFLNSQSLLWHSAPRRQTRQGIATSLEAGTGIGGVSKSLSSSNGGIDREDLHTVIPIQEIGKRQSGTPMNGVGHGQPGDPMFTLQSTAVHGIAATLRACSSTEAGHNARAGDKDENLVAHALRADGFDASEDGTGRGTPLVAATLTKNYATHHGRTAGNNGGVAEGQLIPEISPAIKRRDYKGPSSDGDGDGLPLLPVAFQPRNGHSASMVESGVINALNSEATGASDAAPCVATGYAVRRLVPEEVEKLQGFPPGYTRIPWRNIPPESCPDGPRYKALGNSFAVPVVSWILNRIQSLSNIP